MLAPVAVRPIQHDELIQHARLIVVCVSHVQQIYELLIYDSLETAL
jgi:hypothetical protein